MAINVRLTRLALLLGALLLTLYVTLPLALAHAEYERSEPAAAAVLAAAPSQVRIWFTQELFRRQGENSIEVYTGDGQRVDQGDVTIDDDDRRLLTVALSSTQASGVFTVRWRALSAEDGHPSEGEFSFTVDAATGDQAAGAPIATELAPTAEPAPTATPEATPSAAPAESNDLFCLGVAVPLGLVVGARWVRLRRWRRGWQG